MTSTINTVSDPSVIHLHNGKTIYTTGKESIEEDFDSIPIVDLEGMRSPDKAKRQEVADQIFEACSKVGFFYAKNHGISPEVTKSTFDCAKKFFHELSELEKMKVYTGLLPDSEYQGYHPFDQYNRNNRKYKDLMEAYNFTYEIEYDPLKPKASPDYVKFQNLWPDLEGFKPQMLQYLGECLTVSRSLIRIMALALGLEEDYFDDAVTHPAACARIIHYPVQQATEDEQNGIGAHTDFEIFTLVNPGNASGLQVLNKRGQWIKAPPIEDYLIINVADCLMRLTNDKFVSTVHRVVNTTQERYSIPFFFGLNPSYVLKTLPTCYDKDNPPKYPVTTCRDYLIWRAKKAKARGLNIELKTLESE